MPADLGKYTHQLKCNCTEFKVCTHSRMHARTHARTHTHTHLPFKTLDQSNPDVKKTFPGRCWIATGLVGPKDVLLDEVECDKQHFLGFLSWIMIIIWLLQFFLKIE